MNTKKFTIIHSNDMHGDFLAEMKSGEGTLVGGLALLSGYINKVRAEEENVLYFIAGDMLQGSVIDAEYKGISTIEIMNYLAPDAATLGNHEFDYGLPHLLFLEKMANFPIVNANLYIKNYHKRLMQPYIIINKAGFDILVIGIITDDVIDAFQKDSEIGSFITLEEASNEVGRITNAFKNDDIDLTVLLTHIGFEKDKILAQMLKPEWGVDMIIGGHSHTILDKPAEVNGILIAQAGVGTDQIGRFDITVDDDTNSIVDYKWELIPIDSAHAPKDEELEKFIDTYKETVDKKYSTIITKFTRKLDHHSRLEETELGNLFADIFRERADVDIGIVGSGSIRSKELGPVVTLGDLVACFPFKDTVQKFTISGTALKRMFAKFMSNENRQMQRECYQVSKGIKAIYDKTTDKLVSLSLNEEEIADDKQYSVCLQGYHYTNLKKFLNVDESEISNYKLIATAQLDIIEEYLRAHQMLNSKVEGRLTYIG